MRAADLERIIENKYSLLLFFLISLALISIISTSNALVHFIIDGVFSMVVFVIMLKILKAHRFLFGLYVTLGFLALLFHFLSVFVFHSKPIGIVAMLVYIFIIGLLIAFMIRRIFSERLVTGDTIKGGISVYILMGTWWQLIYYLLWLLNPQSFIFTSDGFRQTDFLYYSMTTMTSLGLGDILPRSYPAKVFSMFQAVVGQLYVAVFVARLIGLHVAVHSSKK